MKFKSLILLYYLALGTYTQKQVKNQQSSMFQVTKQESGSQEMQNQNQNQEQKPPMSLSYQEQTEPQTPEDLQSSEQAVDGQQVADQLYMGDEQYVVDLSLGQEEEQFPKLTQSNKCGGNCSSGRCPVCHCGTKIKKVNINAWCSKHSWDKKCCKCIVSHHSAGNSNAINHNKNGSDDVGLFQINKVYWKQCSAGRAPCDPNVNFQCALRIYKRAKNSWKSWSAAQSCGC